VSPQILFALQFTLSLALFSAIAAWYVVPWLKRVPTHTALAPLFLVHALRYLPSSAFAPGQVGANVPMDAMKAIAYGDLLSAVLALIAAGFLFYRWPGAIGVAWVVNVVTAADWLYAGYVAASRELVTYPMGGNWYIINYYVPLIGVVHVLIFARLLWHSSPHPLTAS
jgi:hypothetical protein